MQTTLAAPAEADGHLEQFLGDGVARSTGHTEDYQQLWAQLVDRRRGGQTVPAGAADGHPPGDGRDRSRAGGAGGGGGDRAAAHRPCGAATRMMALCGADTVTTRRLLDLLDHAVYVSASGELSDVVLSLQGPHAEPVPFGDVITMEEQKTAVYSFELPLQAGAILAGADDADVRRLGEVGRLVGIGFQLLDDLQGMFDDPGVTGKSALTDLREGRMTPLIAHARSTSAWAGIAPHLGDPALDESQAAVVRDMLTSCGSRAFIETVAQSYVGAAIELAGDLGMSEEFVAWVTALTDDLTRRAA